MNSVRTKRKTHEYIYFCVLIANIRKSEDEMEKRLHFHFYFTVTIKNSLQIKSFYTSTSFCPRFRSFVCPISG